MSGTITTVWGQVIPAWIPGLIFLVALLFEIGMGVYVAGFHRGARWAAGEMEKQDAKEPPHDP